MQNEASARICIRMWKRASEAIISLTSSTCNPPPCSSPFNPRSPLIYAEQITPIKTRKCAAPLFTPT